MFQTQYLSARRAMAAAAAMAALAGLAAWAPRVGLAIEPDKTIPARRTFIYEHEFADRPELAAQSHQAVILDLEAASPALGELREHVVRYQLDGKAHNFCLDKNDRYLTRLTVEDESGQPLVKVERGDKCVQAALPPGAYHMRIWHDGSQIGDGGRVAFVQEMGPGVPLTTDYASWTFLGQTGVSGNNSPFTSGNPAAPEGNQVGVIQRSNTSPSFISQSINVPQTGQVQVSLLAAQRAAGAGGSQVVEVFIDDTLLGLITPTSTKYETYTTQAASVTAGTHTLKLVANNTDGDNTAFIDDVQVQMVSGTTTPIAVSNFGFEQPVVGDGQFQYNPLPSFPVGGYWALQPDPSLDPQSRLGRVTIQTPLQPNGEPIIADFSSQVFDENSLFLFKRFPNQPQALANNISLDLTDLTSQPVNLIGNPNLADGSGKLTNGALSFDDLGNAKIAPKFLPSSSYFSLSPANQLQLASPNTQPMTAQVLFRFFPDGMIDPPLREGEVALFQQCNYQGKATVFSLDTPNLSALTSPATTLARSAASIKLGNNTALTLYSGANYRGTSQLITSDAPCLDGTPIGRNTDSLQIQPLAPMIMASSTCENCQLRGVDLSGRDLSGIDLTGADLSGATLTGTNLSGAISLTGTNFTGAKLFCTNFSGTAANPIDLTQTNFTDAQFTEDFSCRANFSYTKFMSQSLSPSLWRYFDLSYAVIEIQDGYSPSSASQPLDLSQAILTGVSLPGVDLTAALLNRARLEGVNLSGAKLYGANLDGANLEGANLSGALLTNKPASGTWTYVGQTGVSGNNSGFTTGNSPAPEGKQVAFIQRGDDSPSYFSQTINIPQAGQARVHFQGAARANEMGGWEHVVVSIDNTLLGVLEPLNTFYEEQVTQFVNVTAGTHTLQFKGVNENQGKDLTAFIDNVRVELVNGGTTTPVDVPTFGFEQPVVGDGQFQYNPSPGGVVQAASLVGAHLKNVNLSNAQLSGANLTDANFYGSAPVGQGACDTSKGFTNGCASAAGATMNNTQFAGAYLYGVDLTNTTIQGVQFAGAVLIGANFAGAKISTDPAVGTESGFSGAFLQGANLAAANLSGTSLLNAFVDFNTNGNDMYLQLDGTHTTFVGWQTPGAKVCVFAFYVNPTTVPTTNTTLTCPDGSPAGSGGCGPAAATNTRWRSLVEIDQTNPPASYLQNSTYTKAGETPICSPFNTNW